MEAKRIKDLKNGEYFTLKPIEEPKESQVWVKGDYERKEKKYSCTKWNDFCKEKFFKGVQVVYVDFEF